MHAGRCRPTAAEQRRFNGSSVFPERFPQRQVRVRAQQPRGAAAQVLAAEGPDGQAAALSELEEEVLRQVAVAAHASMASGVPEATSAAWGQGWRSAAPAPAPRPPCALPGPPLIW